MRFRAEFEMDEADCSFCPFFMRAGNEEAFCNLADVRGEPQHMASIAVRGWERTLVVQAFPMPIDCPLVPVIEEEK